MRSPIASLSLKLHLAYRPSLTAAARTLRPIALAARPASSMPPKKAGAKRKPSTSQSAPNKRARDSANGSAQASSSASASEPTAVVDRRFYPAEMSAARCKEYTSGELQRPGAALAAAQSATSKARAATKPSRAVVHWFRRDLRLRDNKPLSQASAQASKAGVPLIGLYVLCPQDLEAHLTSPVQVDFVLRSLEVLRSDLAALDVPLHIETVGSRADVPRRVLELCGGWGASHVYATAEYEVDELRRDARLVSGGAEQGVAVEVVHDACVVDPGDLTSGTGNQYAVYTPWFRAWVRHLHANPDLLRTFDGPAKNPKAARKEFGELFEGDVPEAPAVKALSHEERERFAALWPAGEHAAEERLDKFLDERIKDYDNRRNFPAANGTSVISVHLAVGTLGARSVVMAARDANSTKNLDGGNSGIATWISEVAWRDFYKHVLVAWPYVCMNKPFKPEYANIKWEYSEENLAAWKAGRTGYPIVDAAMRQLNHTGYMHNRCRMVVASFLSKHLLLDWRLGEQYFMSRLVDGDFASNNGGWGFSSSTGVDPQPYFRIFNPLLQSERFDRDGDYIRKWVPELKDLDNKQIHEPWTRGGEAIAKKNGYPKPLVEHKVGRERALARYKEALGRGTA